MDGTTILQLMEEGGIFITAWIVLDRVFDYMFGTKSK